MDQELLDTAIRLGASLLAGGIIGLERSINGRPAGFRTHSLVCMSSSLLMLLTVYQWQLLANAPMDTIRVDPTRMAQGIMTGIGFLGAGVIMKDRFTIRGLTTAASIWMTASIGILIGMGFFTAAGMATALALGTLYLFRFFEGLLPSLQFGRLSIRTKRALNLDEDAIKDIIKNCNIQSASIGYSLEGEGNFSKFEMVIKTRQADNFRRLAETLTEMEEIQEFNITPRSG